MKILNKIKKGLMGIGLFFLALPSKVLASSTNIISNSEQFIQDLYDTPTALYGVYKPSPISNIWRIWSIAKIFVIPIALVVGLIIYFKKSKSSIKRKIFFTVLVILIIVVCCFVGDIIFKKIFK